MISEIVKIVLASMHIMGLIVVILIIIIKHELDKLSLCLHIVVYSSMVQFNVLVGPYRYDNLVTTMVFYSITMVLFLQGMAEALNLQS